MALAVFVSFDVVLKRCLMEYHSLEVSSMMSFKERYEHIYQSNNEFIKDNQINIDPLPVDGDSRWGVSVVFRPKIPLEVWRDLDKLKPLLGENHFYYCDNNVHVTFRSLEAYRQTVYESDNLVKRYAEVLKTTFSDVGRMRISLRGIVGVKSGLILCGIPDFNMADLRLDFFERLQQSNLVTSGPETSVSKLRNTCHASLTVFSSELDLPAESHEMLSNLRHKDYGEVDVTDIEIVSYRRTLDVINVQSLTKIDLS
ncbi:hypothetical protein MSP8886_01476 [Marinomonas spartinae]|uniref:Uncharacterized protein n=1 Tax=Marinomonas spartinae TaxID=1792290 RepID=A0A1A8TC58_9GAMM|nr:hypothetical protein [Marinomonas spartinae]SBS29210.1 hypothetical protein MSP8886_01476 [Marinomonas spartinae]